MSEAAIQVDGKLEPPIPLSGPDGRLFGYACARCLHVKSSIEGGTFESRLQHSLEDAQRCCSCRDCGKRLNRRWQCDDCAKAERQKWNEHLEATRPQREAEQARRDAALAKSKDRNSALLLQSLMSDISEDHYCAGWMSGLEFSLWRIVEGGERFYGMGEVTTDEVAQLKQLSDHAGGWWYFDETDGETFIPADDWRQKYLATPRA